MELRVRNYRTKPMILEATLVLPAGWKASPEILSLTVLPKEDGQGVFTLTIPENWDRSKPRVALAADVVADGQYLGEIVEGVYASCKTNKPERIYPKKSTGVGGYHCDYRRRITIRPRLAGIGSNHAGTGQ
jgi:hypothetical protein